VKQSALKVAIVGAGYIAQKSHIPAWKKLAKVVAIIDTDIEKAKRLAKFSGIAPIHVYPTLEEFFLKQRADIVDICTPPMTHASLAIEAMKLGAHVVVEKPLCLSLKEAERISTVVEQEKVKLCVCHDYLFWPTTIKAKRILQEGKLGQLNGLLIKHFEWKNDPRLLNKDFWYHKLQGGIFGHILAHPLYIALDFLGELNVTNAIALKQSNREWIPFDWLFISLKTKNEQFANIMMSCNSPRGHIEVNLFGEKQILHISNFLLAYKEESKGNSTLSSIRETLHMSSSIAFSLIPRLVNRLYGYSSHYLLFKKFIETIYDISPSVCS